MEEQRTQRKCVFCGNPAGSGEHVYPDWLRKQYGKTTATVVIEQEGGKNLTFSGALFQQTVKKVCGNCNNGWMHRIEEGVSSYLGDMILSRNYPVQLDDSRQHALALWAQKTFMVVQSTFDEAGRNASEQMYSEMFVRKNVLLASATFIGFNETALVPGGHAAGMRANQLISARLAEKDNTPAVLKELNEHRFLAASLRVGAVNFHMIMTDMENVEFEFQNSLRGFIQLISPTPEHSLINWPTTIPVEVFGDWEKIHETFVEDLHVSKLTP
jgi:hypothetical protein